MKKTRVVFLGSRPLGHLALNLLRNMADVEVVASVVREPPADAWWQQDPHQIADHAVLEHQSLGDIEFDFGVSVNYWKLMEPKFLSKPKLGIVNLHHSYNLSCRGRDTTSHAILAARKSGRWYHGTSLHYTDDGLDTGPVIASRSCEMTETDTAWTLFHKVERLGADLLKEWLPRLVRTRAPVAYPEPDTVLNRRTVRTDKFIADVRANPLLTYDIVRAFDFKLHFSPAFTVIDGSEIFLTTDIKLAGEPLLAIDKDRAIYKVAKQSLSKFQTVA